jgi:uncharacterized protein
VGVHVEVASGTPVLLLREQDVPQRVVALYVGEIEAVAIALGLDGVALPRPMTHDLLAELIESLRAHVDHVEVTEIRAGTFIAEVAVTGPGGERRIDSRPSDAIALALRVDAPVFVSDAVLDESGAQLGVPDDDTEVDDDSTLDDATTLDEVDEVVVDEELQRFRAFLADVEPSQFSTDPDDGPDEPPPASPDP